MALFGSIAAVRSQAPQTSGFEVAFAYLDDLLRPGSVTRARLDGMAPGESKKIELRAGVFAIEQVYEAKPRADGFFESHRRFIDVQAIIEGAELMEVTDIARIIVRDPYAPERDLVTYQDTSHASEFRVRRGEAAVFFPVDVHMPSLRLQTAPGLVRKSVVKIPVD